MKQSIINLVVPILIGAGAGLILASMLWELYILGALK